MRGHGDHNSRLIYELCALLLTILSPPSPPRRRQHTRSSSSVMTPSITPAAVASLLFGVSLALMLCGSVTFVIGFFLMPWVVAFVFVFGFVGVVSNLTGIWKSVLSCGTAGGPKEVS